MVGNGRGACCYQKIEPRHFSPAVKNVQEFTECFVEGNVEAVLDVVRIDCYLLLLVPL
jgi:hypothetical protein